MKYLEEGIPQNLGGIDIADFSRIPPLGDKKTVVVKSFGTLSNLAYLFYKSIRGRDEDIAQQLMIMSHILRIASLDPSLLRVKLRIGDTGKKIILSLSPEKVEALIQQGTLTKPVAKKLANHLPVIIWNDDIGDINYLRIVLNKNDKHKSGFAAQMKIDFQEDEHKIKAKAGSRNSRLVPGENYKNTYYSFGFLNKLDPAVGAIHEQLDRLYRVLVQKGVGEMGLDEALSTETSVVKEASKESTQQAEATVQPQDPVRDAFNSSYDPDEVLRRFNRGAGPNYTLDQDNAVRPDVRRRNRKNKKRGFEQDYSDEDE